MEKKINLYERARKVVQDLGPVLHLIREYDKSLAEQLKRAAQSVVLNIAEARGNDAGNARARSSGALQLTYRRGSGRPRHMAGTLALARTLALAPPASRASHKLEQEMLLNEVFP